MCFIVKTNAWLSPPWIDEEHLNVPVWHWGLCVAQRGQRICLGTAVSADQPTSNEWLDLSVDTEFAI